MNPKSFLEYKVVLDELSFEEFSVLRNRVLSKRLRYRELAGDELVCPIAEEVRDRSLCSACPLKPDCPNFKL